jgi:endoglucanase
LGACVANGATSFVSEVSVRSREFFGWFMVAGMLAALGGCGDEPRRRDRDDDCDSGTEGCRCKSGNRCDDGLVCEDKECVDPNAPNGAGGDGSASGGSGNQPAGGTGNTGSGATSGGASGGSGNTGNTGGGASGGAGAQSSSGGSAGTMTNTGPTPVERHGQLSVSGTNLVDGGGQPVKLEGMSSMWLNWEPTGYALNGQGLAWMRDNWNLRVFRIAMGVYSESDSVNTYLADPAKNAAWVNTIVQNAINAGVYVIIDWHDHEAIAHQAEALAFFDEMSERWGDYPNVIYEVFNEPLALNWAAELKPYHEAVVAAIRENDPDNVIVLGTPNWDQDVHVAASDPLTGGNLMYALHFYACTHQAELRQRAQAAFQSGLPLFVTEWGATHADGGLDGVVCDAEARAWHDWLDSANISWAAWKLDGCTDSTCMFKDQTAPVTGGWTTSMLNGHAPLVIEEMTNDPPDPGSGGGAGSGGSGGAGGSSGSAGSGASGGSAGNAVDLTEKPAACALVSTCPACCTTAGVFALDSDDPPNDATQAIVTDWSADASGAQASFAFTTANEVGAIFFRFAELQYISSLGVDTAGTDLAPEVALVKDGGASGCVYVDDGVGWIENGCWGTPDYTFDQIEVRLRSFGSATATLTVHEVVYE